MTKHVLFAAFLFLCAFAKAQSYTISGTLKDTTTKQPLDAATIFLETKQDSTLLTYTISNRKGEFTLEGRTKLKEARMNISFVGYEAYTKDIILQEEALNLGDIFLELAAQSLDEVVLKSRAPVTVKKDTLEFNVASFKTKENASVEDLLKELPGVEVDEEGKILVNGKEVNQILVNGKPFFGNDPTIATRNLTKDIIDKIQVVDTKTKDEEFAGEEGDSENKTINLTIKEENNKGTFGRLSAGGGTDQRFEYAGIVNRFDNDRRLSVLGGGNNTNSPGFSFGEIQKMFGNGNSMTISSTGSFSIDGRSFGGGSGIVNSRNAGATYADVLSEKVDINADYFYSGANNFNDSRTDRENILPDRRFFTSSTAREEGNTDNHEINANLEIEVDSTFLITYQPGFRRTDRRGLDNGNETSRDTAGTLINSSQRARTSTNTANNFGNELSLTKRFGTAGSFLKLRIENEMERQRSDERLTSEAVIFEDGVEIDRVDRNQRSDGEIDFDSWYAQATYRLPLVSKKMFLDFRYSYRNDNRRNRLSTFDADPSGQVFDTFNEALSTDFDFTNIRSTPALAFVYNADDWNANIEVGYVSRTLKNTDELRPELSIEEDFNAIELSSNFNYRFNEKTSTYMGYNLSNRPPQLSQLNPFLDVSDPLNTVEGNPALKPSNNHSLYVGFNSYDFQKGGGIYSYFNATVTTDDVVRRTTIDENLVRNTTFENVDGNYSAYGSLSYNKQIKLDTVGKINYRFGLYGNVNRNINFNNDVKYESNNSSITPNVSVGYTWNKVLEIRPRYNLSFSRTRFDLEDFEDQEFIRHSLTTSLNVLVPKNVTWRNEINYSYNPQVADGFQRSVWFWNSTLTYTFMKDQASLALKVYDVLGQNNNARRTATANFIQDSQSTVLQRYAMLSFSWKFNTLGSKGETRETNFLFF